jgi:hypothetical protein
MDRHQILRMGAVIKNHTMPTEIHTQVVVSQHLQLDMRTNPADDALDLDTAAWSRLSFSLHKKFINPHFEDSTIQLRISPTVTQTLARLYWHLTATCSRRYEDRIAWTLEHQISTFPSLR